jgi:hypothetical protein
LADEGVVEAGKGINVLHHASGSMDNGKVIAKQFLSPAADDMNRTGVIENFLDSATVAYPIKEGTPEKLLVLRNGPVAASSFSDEGMEVALLFCTLARVKTDRPEPCAAESEIEMANAVVGKLLGGGNGSVAVIGLH